VANRDAVLHTGKNVDQSNEPQELTLSVAPPLFSISITRKNDSPLCLSCSRI